MPIYTHNGVPVIDAYGVAYKPRDPDAPNRVDFLGDEGTVTRIPADGSGEASLQDQLWCIGITVPEGVKYIRVVARGETAQGTATKSSAGLVVPVPDLVEGAGVTNMALGTVETLLRHLADFTNITIHLYAMDADRREGIEFNPDGYPITPFEEDDDDDINVVVIAEPVITTAAEELEEGAPYAFSPLEVDGTEVHITYTFYTNDTEDQTTPVENEAADAATRLPAITSGRKYMYVHYSVWGTGVPEETPLTGISNIIEILPATVEPPAQLTPEQWRIPIGLARTDVSPVAFQLPGVELLDSVDAVRVQGTTQLTGTDEELRWEELTPGSSSAGWKRWGADAVWLGNDGEDYRIFNTVLRPGDDARAGRVRIRHQVAGSSAWSPSTVVKRCESPFTSVLADFHQPVIMRSKEQHDQRQRGGGGYQLPRMFTKVSPAAPNRVWVGLDVLPPIKTEFFGDLWEFGAMNGMVGGRSCEGIAIDSEDGDRIIAMMTGSSQRGNSQSGNVWDTVSGPYLSTDGGDNWTLPTPMPNVAGCGERASGSRFIRNCLLEVPGGTPTTRKWYCFNRRYPKGAATALHTRLWRSTNGGSSWHTSASGWAGFTFDVATFGENLRFIVRKSNTGWYYIGSEKGLWVSKDECQSWTKLNAPSGDVRCIDVGGPAGEIWILVGGATRGLYKHTNNGEGSSGTWVQQKTGKNYHFFGISPHNRNCIIVLGDNQVKPQRSMNGGGSWADIVCQAYPGQPPGNYQQQLWGDHSQVIFHPTDDKLVIGLAKTHFMICRDVQASTCTFVFGSSGWDSINAQAACEDPGKQGDIFMNCTDRLGTYMNNLVYAKDCENDDTVKNAVESYTEPGHVGNAGGCLFLRSPDGTKKAPIVCIGPSQENTRALVRHSGPADNPAATGLAIDCRPGNTTKGNGFAVKKADTSRGLVGRWECRLANNDILTVIDQGVEVFGYDSQGRKYGAALGASVIKRASADSTSYSNFVTCLSKPAPYDGSLWFEVDQNHANRLIYPTSDGRLRRVTGDPGNQSDVLIFDMRDFISGVPSGWDYQLHRCRIDYYTSPFTVAYVSAYIYGKPCLWRTLDFTASSVVWEDITFNKVKMPHHLSVLPDGSLFIGSLGGMSVASRPGATKSRLYEAARVYNSQIIEQT